MKLLFLTACKLLLLVTLVSIDLPIAAQISDTVVLKKSALETVGHDSPPIPVEVLVGNRQLYYQTTAKKNFTSNSKFSFFSLATFSADYKNKLPENRMLIEGQLSYSFKNGFGIMTGVDINSVTGFAPILGPQHTYASRKVLAVTIFSFILNKTSDAKLFGLYEYKPALNKKWQLYNRLQFLYIHSMGKGTHSRSYVYLRSGVKINQFVVGLGANLDQFGPKKEFQENIGTFFRWEFR